MRIREALDRIGYDVPEGMDAFVLVPGPNGLRTAPLSRAIDSDLDGTVYLSGGAFVQGGKRRGEDLRSVTWLALDCDLIDHLGIPAEDVRGMDDAALDDAIHDLAILLMNECARHAIPLHRVDSTGYGCCGYIMIDGGDRRRVAEIGAVYKRIISRLNADAGIRVDPQVSDAGTRITRIPGDGATNTKNPSRPRPVRILHETGESIGLDALLALAGEEIEVFDRPAPGPAVPVDVPPDIHGELVAILRPAWGNLEGQRHSIALGLAGVLWSLGVSEHDAHDLVLDIAAGDEEWMDRTRCVRSTYATADAGGVVSGWSRLTPALPHHVLRDLRIALSPLERVPETTILMGGEPLPNVEMSHDFDPPPDECFRGWVARYLDQVAMATEASDAYHLGTAMTVAGAMMGRRAWMNYGGRPIYPNLFSVMIGSAGSSRKDSAVKLGVYADGILAYGRQAGDMTASQYRLIRDIGSSQALIDVLAEGVPVLAYISELARITRNSRRQGTADLLPTLLEAWDCPPVMETVSRASEKQANKGRAENPFLSMVACIQPEILSQEFGAEDSESGLTSRISYFCGAGKPDPLPDPVAPDGWEMRNLYQELSDARAALIPSAGIQMDPGTKEMWTEFYVRDRVRPFASLAEDKIRTRLGAKARKYALIYAASEFSRAVTVEHLGAGIALVEWEWAQIGRIAGDWGASVDNVLERKVIDALRGGPQPMWAIRERTRSPRWGATNVANVVRAMKENGTVVELVGGVLALTEGV